MTFAHAALYIYGIATGVLLYDSAIERQHPAPSRSVQYCPPANAAGQALAASMVSSAAGTPTSHECYYR